MHVIYGAIYMKYIEHYTCFIWSITIYIQYTTKYIFSLWSIIHTASDVI
jgi:hypothetical protein